MKISQQKPCLPRGQKGALSALPRVGLSHARPLATPGPASAPRSMDSPGGRTGGWGVGGTLTFPPREQTQVSYTGRWTLYHQRPGKPRGPAAQPRSQTPLEGADLRPRREGGFLPARQQLSQ